MAVEGSALQYEWLPNGDFSMRFDPVRRTPEGWRAELSKAAIAVAGSAGKPIWLGVSGGLDSEIMCRAFFDEGVQFAAITLAHRGNKIETARAKKWCFDHGVPHTIVPLDEVAFLTDSVDAYMKAGYVTQSVYRYLQIRILEEIESRGGYGVLGYGKLNIQNEDLKPFITFGLSFAAPFEWAKRSDTAHTPYFFLATPEIVQSYFSHPIVQGALQAPEVFSNVANNIPLRRLVYQTAWPDVQARHSLLGFEAFPGLKDLAERRMKEAFKPVNRTLRLTVAECMRELAAES